MKECTDERKARIVYEPSLFNQGQASVRALKYSLQCGTFPNISGKSSPEKIASMLIHSLSVFVADVRFPVHPKDVSTI